MDRETIDPFAKQLTGLKVSRPSFRNLSFLSAETFCIGLGITAAIQAAGNAVDLDIGKAVHNSAGAAIIVPLGMLIRRIDLLSGTVAGRARVRAYLDRRID